MAVEAEAAGRGEGASGQGASLFEGALDEGRLADHSGAEHLGQRSARLSRGEGIRELAGFAELVHIGVAVHGQGVERDDPVADPAGLGLERPCPVPVRQRLVKLADERAVKHVHQREPHRQLGLPARIDRALPGERDSARTALERPPPQQLGRHGQQELGRVREELGPDLAEVERADDGRVRQHVAHDPLIEQAECLGLFTGGQQMPCCRADLIGLDQVARGGLM